MKTCSICQRSLECKHIEKVKDTYVCKNCIERVKRHYIDDKTTDMSAKHYKGILLAGSMTGFSLAYLITCIYIIF